MISWFFHDFHTHPSYVCGLIFFLLHPLNSHHITRKWYQYHPGPQSGHPPTLIKVLTKGSLLLQATSISLFRGTSPHLDVINRSLPTT
jgi:hypothetical protein